MVCLSLVSVSPLAGDDDSHVIPHRENWDAWGQLPRTGWTVYRYWGDIR